MDAVRNILLGLLLVGWCFNASAALADKRVALVIGNSAYQKVAKLPNPANDAASVAAMFKSAGFDFVETKLNVTASELRRTLREFGAKSRDADVAVIFYAGHGIELSGNNYLIPVDAALETDADVLDETVALDRILFAVEPAKQLRLIILDACRDNPFARTMRRTIASRAVGRGLAKVEPTSPNTMIAFAAKAGSTASDGDSRNSPFAAALVEHLPKPGLDLRRAFGFVRDDVLKNTGNKQEPYVYGSLGGDDMPLVPAKPAASGPQADPQSAVRRDYELALQAGERDAWEAFLQAYPDGFYANLAKVQLKKIAAEEARAAAAEKARLAEQEKARLAAEGAKQAEIAKAAAAARAAEAARLAAEKARQVEQEKAAAAEKARLAQQEEARLAAEKALADKNAKDAVPKESEKVASLQPTAATTMSPVELSKSLQQELRRVGCLTANADGEWNAVSEKSLGLFNKHAGARLDVKTASIHALDALKSKSARVCPLVCEAGYRADGERCVKIACRAGYEVGDDGKCEKIEVRKPVAKRPEPPSAAKPPAPPRTAQQPARSQSPGGTYQECDSSGCRPTREKPPPGQTQTIILR